MSSVKIASPTLIASNAAVASKDPGPLAEHLAKIVADHPCDKHPLFSRLETIELTVENIAALLRNYDAHASVLRRLLLKAASLMPEMAVGCVLENVRNEYGNGDNRRRHQLQLVDLAMQSGVSEEAFANAPIEPAVRTYISLASELYYSVKMKLPGRLYRPAIAAGAITATEIMAIVEFKAMQIAFSRLGFADHIWFDHVSVECDHTDESIALAQYFVDHHDALDAVEFGFTHMLDANEKLYDGFLAALS